MLAAVDPVLGKVEGQKIEHEAHPWDVTHPGPELVQVKGAHAMAMQPPKSGVEQRVDREKQRYPEQAQAVNQGVHHVRANAGAVCHRLHRPPALQRTDHSQHDQDLQKAYQQPAGGHIAVF